MNISGEMVINGKSKMCFFQLNNKLRWKFVDKLANFVIDKSIKDYEIKIDILRLFSILQLSEEFGRYIFVHCIYDTDIQLNYSLEDIDDNLSEDVKEKRKNQHWLLQLINSFGIKTDVSLTNWQCAIVRFYFLGVQAVNTGIYSIVSKGGRCTVILCNIC